MILVKQMAILFIMMLIGWFLAKQKKLGSQESGFLSYLIVNVANPCLVLSGCVNGTFLELNEFLSVAGLAIGVYAVLLILAGFVLPLFWNRGEEKARKELDVYKLMLVFSNIGFMGVPILSALYGDRAVLYSAAFLIAYNMLIYTFGIKCITGEMGSTAETIKKCINIGTMAGILAIVLSLLHIQIPGVLGSSISMLSSLAAPLSMMVIGASFCGKKVGEIFGDVRLIIFSLVKLIVLPLVGIALIRLVTSDLVLQGTAMVILATPVGSMCAMMARSYEGDYEKASQGVAVTTVMSIVTMPLVFMLAGLS